MIRTEEYEEISEDEFAELESAKTKKGKWSELCEHVKSSGQAVKKSGLSRGQVAALVRAAEEAGLRSVANYKKGQVALAP